MPLDLISIKKNFKKIQIYENDIEYFFFGIQADKKQFSLIRFKKIEYDLQTVDKKLENLLFEDKDLSFEEKEELFHFNEHDPKTKLRGLLDCKLIFGFVKFVIGYYVILVTGSSKVGKIGQHKIKRLESIKILPLYQTFDHPLLEMENKYLTIFKNFDLLKQAYFSQTYNLTKTVQMHFVEQLKSDFYTNWEDHYKFEKSGEKKKDLNKMSRNIFLWNDFHIREFFEIVENMKWITFFIYGYIGQSIVSDYGHRFVVTIIARRNRHFAGTRYLKREISDEGHVANDVETEQILEEVSTTCADKPIISSYLHIRGSVPIYWYQETTTLNIKPQIKVNYYDIHFKSTQKHFAGLIERYGIPILACNLTKMEQKFKSESLLNVNYENAVNEINYNLTDKNKIRYYHYDVKVERKFPTFYAKFFEIAQDLIQMTNIFSYYPHMRQLKIFEMVLQEGVIRSNCVDCLDRTNVFQQVIGIAVIYNQLLKMGLNIQKPQSDNEEIYGVLTDMYKNMGHEISLQYAGSSAHKQNINTQSNNGVKRLIDKLPEIFNVFKRYVNNSFNDQYKQAGINLFLGKYQPKNWKFNLWEYTNDIVFHRTEPYLDIEKNWDETFYQKFSEFSLINDIVERTNPEFLDESIKNEIKICSVKNKMNTFLIDLMNYKRVFERLKLAHVNSFKNAFELKFLYKNIEKKPTQSEPTQIVQKTNLNTSECLTKRDEDEKIFQSFPVTFEIDNEEEKVTQQKDFHYEEFLNIECNQANYNKIFDRFEENPAIYYDFCDENLSTGLENDILRMYQNQNGGKDDHESFLIHNIKVRENKRREDSNNLKENTNYLGWNINILDTNENYDQNK